MLPVVTCRLHTTMYLNISVILLSESPTCTDPNYGSAIRRTISVQLELVLSWARNCSRETEHKNHSVNSEEVNQYSGTGIYA